MNGYAVCSGRVPAEKIEINRAELLRRLNAGRDFEASYAEDCIRELTSVLDFRYAYIKAPVLFSGGDSVDIGFGKIKSKNLYSLLKGCKYAFVLAVTSGIAVDRLLARLSVKSPARHFITDAAASAAIESFCDYMDLNIRGASEMPRFSPGYGDLPLEIQPSVLAMLDASRTLGITLNSALLMTPAKSITAVMGCCDE